MCATASGIVVVGLGNPILTDDAVGLLVARRLASRWGGGVATVRESPSAGLDLLELLAGYRRAHLIDAVVTGRRRAGYLWRFEVEDLPPALTLAGSHEVDLATALALGHRLGYSLPQRPTIWGIEVEDPFTVSEHPTARVARALPSLVRRIARAVERSD